MPLCSILDGRFPRASKTPRPTRSSLDIAGLASLFGSAANIANEFVARASLLGLTANVAIASNIEAALLASRGFPGITLIPPGEESQRLGILPVQVLPAPPETLETLDRWGVRTCAAWPPCLFSIYRSALGRKAFACTSLARGANVRSLVLAQTSLSFEEEMALEDSVEELEPLSFILGRLLDQLCARLNARALAAQFHSRALRAGARLRKWHSAPERRSSPHRAQKARGENL